ncbi:MAG: DNA mismatch repair endonuclease MutL [Ruminococcaceae bacterium]|nr:DNA mismatch repair endonuclease MutL [Oscillospiraceae bacterium]
MGKINVLSFAVANLIAAGEVVDRPASVIKELLENAIDSGANRITVEIQNGGVTYMRVADNGCGIEPEDLPTAIRRHATSKIKDAKDLEGIITLGFRGEALAAIAAVSSVRIISKTKGASVGAMLEAHNGEIAGVSERACSDGTTVIVENLFGNVPARRKFLKKDVTEAMAIGAVVEKIALSKPHIAFRLISDGNLKLETMGDGNLKTAVYSVFGREFASKLIDTEIELDGIEVRGYIGRSDNVRANRNYQNFFINGRYVKSKTAMAALEQAFTSYIPPEKFPCCVLFITINPAAVDVNVHPSKLEVKFSNEKPVFEAIYYAVKNSLEANASRPGIVLGALKTERGNRLEERLSDTATPISEGKAESLKKRQVSAELYTAPTPEKTVSEKKLSKSAEGGFSRMSAEEYVNKIVGSAVKREGKSESRTAPVAAKPTHNDKSTATVSTQTEIPIPSIQDKKEVQPPALTERAPEVKAEPTVSETKKISYRIIGEAFNSYVLVEVEDKLLVIDKHAAHERIIFEQLKAGMKNRAKVSQLLMLPIEVMLTSDEIQTISDYRDEIEAVGFEFTNGRFTVSVTAIPEGIEVSAIPDMLAVIAERIKSNTGSAKLTRDIIFEKALYQASCKAAIKAGREYAEGHIKWIVDKLMEIPDITVCPHGRPVAMELSKKTLDRQFERT